MLAHQHDTFQTLSTSIHTIHQEYLSLDRSIQYTKRILFLKRLVVPVLRWFYPESEKEMVTLEEELHAKQIKCDAIHIALPQVSTKEWEHVLSAYNTLLACKGKWVVSASYATERVSERTPAVIDRVRREIVFEHENIPFIQSEQKPMYFPAHNGSSWFIYPTIIILQNNNDIDVYPLHELQLSYEDIEYIEEKEPFSDAVLLRQTWTNANIDGTADKRFRDNAMVPIFRYGLLILRIHANQEKLIFTNAVVSRAFAKILSEYSAKKKR